MTNHDSLLRLGDVCQRTGLSRSTIYRRMNEGTFPPTCSLGGRVKAWRSGEVQAWIDARVPTSSEPWLPPSPPPRVIGEKKPPPLVPNEKGAEAAAKVAGVVGLEIADGEVLSDRDITLRFPDWLEMMRQRTAAAYLDLSESAFIREVYRGTLPNPILLGGRQSWSRHEIDASIAQLLTAAKRRR